MKQPIKGGVIAALIASTLAAGYSAWTAITMAEAISITAAGVTSIITTNSLPFVAGTFSSAFATTAITFGAGLFSGYCLFHAGRWMITTIKETSQTLRTKRAEACLS